MNNNKWEQSENGKVSSGDDMKPAPDNCKD